VTRAGLWLRVANTFMDQGGKRPRATREAPAHAHHSGDASTTEQVTPILHRGGARGAADESHAHFTRESRKRARLRDTRARSGPSSGAPRRLAPLWRAPGLRARSGRSSGAPRRLAPLWRAPGLKRKRAEAMAAPRHAARGGHRHPWPCPSCAF